jgi:hypothetical protein
MADYRYSVRAAGGGLSLISFFLARMFGRNPSECGTAKICH